MSMKANQHWTPKFLLNRFAVKKMLVVHNIDTGKILTRARSTKSCCSQEYFHAQRKGIADQTSQDFEEYMGIFETKFAPIVKQFEQDVIDRKEISEQQIRNIAFFASHLMLRGVKFRDMIEGGKKQLKEGKSRITAGMVDLDQKAKSAVLKKIEDEYLDSLEDNSTHLEMIVNSTLIFGNLLYSRKVTAYISCSSDLSFIVTDTPVIDVSPQQRNGFRGPGLFEREQYMSLSPRVILHFHGQHFRKPEEFINKKGKHLKRQSISTEAVNTKNILFMTHSYKEAFSSSSREFEYALNDMNDRLNKHRDQRRKEFEEALRKGFFD